ncbi:MAG TPA: gephyrin-like molybdotransferase Glp [Cellulomonas sp.]
MTAAAPFPTPGRSVVRSVEQHLAALLAQARPLAPAALTPWEALGLVLGEDVVADLDLPPFDNSAMDGYAVRLADVAGAAEGSPVVLQVRADVAAGSAAPEGGLVPGCAARIMTGAPVPEGTQAVVPVEWTDGGTDRVEVRQEPRPAANIRRRGEDVARGATVLSAGTVVTPAVVGLLAGIGRGEVLVHRRPHVVVVSTGSELVDPGEEAGPAQIHDANRPMLAAAASATGARVTLVPIVRDEPGALVTAIQGHLDGADLILTSAGVSEGAYDVVKADLLALAGDDGHVEFSAVAMQPGKPQGHGWLGPRRVPVITLPGNPVSAYVSFQVFVRPVLRRLLGHPGLLRRTVRAVLTADVRSPAGRRQYLRARLEPADPTAAAGPAHPRVVPVGGPGSHLLGSLARSNALVVIAEDTVAVMAGEVVEVMVLEEENA